MKKGFVLLIDFCDFEIFFFKKVIALWCISTKDLQAFSIKLLKYQGNYDNDEGMYQLYKMVFYTFQSVYLSVCVQNSADSY